MLQKVLEYKGLKSRMNEKDHSVNFSIDHNYGVLSLTGSATGFIISREHLERKK